MALRNKGVTFKICFRKCIITSRGASNPGGSYGIILLIPATYSNNEAKTNRTNNPSSL